MGSQPVFRLHQLTRLADRATATTAVRNKTANDAEFKAFLGVFVDNQLTVLYMPEWPGSVVGLMSMARLLVGRQDEPRSCRL